ncbi:MAG: hypothetical protein HQM14_20160 [SAR324 cluster bacterium]|nr:hypothetical protein [SAR324 cluster bacterium]
MTILHEIEEAVSRLSETELNDFRKWFEEFDQQLWDEQFEADVQSGNLDSIADQAIADFKAGKCKEI